MRNWIYIPTPSKRGYAVKIIGSIESSHRAYTYRIAGTGNDSNLKHCLDQALSQSYANREIIVVSPLPAPPSWLQNLAAQEKIKLSVLPKASEKDLYHAGALEAKGAYLTFQNSLEFFHQPDSLETLLSSAE